MSDNIPNGTGVVFTMAAGIEKLFSSTLLIALTSNLYVVRSCSPTAVNILSLSPVPLTIKFSVMLSPTVLSLDLVAVTLTLKLLILPCLSRYSIRSHCTGILVTLTDVTLSD